MLLSTTDDALAATQNPQTQIGVHHTGHLSAGRRTTFAEEVLVRNPYGGVRLYPLLDMMSSMSVDNTIKMFDIKTAYHPTLKMKSDAPAVRPHQQATIEVESTNGIIPNMLFVAGPFGQQLMVTDVTGPNTLVVTRGLGTVLPGVLRAGQPLIYSGEAFEEGSLRPLMRATSQGEMLVQTQIFRHSWGLTHTLRETLSARDAKHGGIHGLSAAEGKQQAMDNHALAIESFLLFGQQSASVYNGMPMRTGSGVFEFIKSSAPQNVITVAGDMNIADLGKIFGTLGDVTINNVMNPRRLMVVHKSVIDTVTAIATMQGVPMHTVGQETNILGQRYTRFSTPRMDFELMEHPLFNINEAFHGAGLAVDPTSMQLGYLGNRKTQHQYYNQDANGSLNPVANDNGIDQSGGTFTTELMFVCKNPGANGAFFNLLGARPSHSCCPPMGNGGNQ